MNEVIEGITGAVTMGALALNAWHHAGWPVAMKLATRFLPPTKPVPPIAEAELPEITVVMPAYNEARYIADKLRNLAEQDYPADRLRVLVVCDGCTDVTAELARAAIAEPGCAGLQAVVIEHLANRGKVAVLNQTIPFVRSELVVLTDVSAMLSPDALRRAAAHFADASLGAVGGTYRLVKPGSKGEGGYWRYQVMVKRAEAALGMPLGLHGAFYAFRRVAWQPLPRDTINDDFILPTEIFGRGWRVTYDESIVAHEIEIADPAQDARRRRRIAAGNAQQLARLSWLLNPRFGMVALCFLSGKALRTVAPFLFAVSLFGAVAIASVSSLFATLAALQIAGLIAAASGLLLGRAAPRLLALAGYAAVGHLSSAAGVIRYCSVGQRQPWVRVTESRAAALPDAA